MLVSDREITGIHLPSSKVEDVHFEKCYFQGCSVGGRVTPELRTSIRKVSLNDIRIRGCSLKSAIFEDVTINGLNTHGQLLIIWAAAFSRVTLSGSIGRIMYNSLISGTEKDSKLQHAYDIANQKFYENVEWALDISNAHFTAEFELRGFPGHLIKRDSETQFLFKREKLSVLEWKALPFQGDIIINSLNMHVQANEESIVLVAPKKNKNFKVYLHDLQLLRKEGFAEME